MILAGERILTAAHVVKNAVMVEVRRRGSDRRFTAEVAHICSTCDLALLSVPDGSFFDGVVPVEIGGLPDLQDPVEIHGFPVGGKGASITTGVVSRIGVDVYTESARSLLLMQVDAALNPGNSGGPALDAKQRLVGIAIQALTDAENIGYVVPIPVIEHFLEDVEDGRFDGFPELGLRLQSLENEALRESLGLGNAEGGVVVTGVSAEGSARGVLHPGDVLLAIDGVGVAEDNTTVIREGLRVGSIAISHRAQVGDVVDVQFARGGVVQTASVRMTAPNQPLVELTAEPNIPHRVFAGLVFQELSKRYLEWFEEAPVNLGAYSEDPKLRRDETLVSPPSTEARTQVIVISSVLPGECTRGYEFMEDEVVYSVDGVVVRNLSHLSELLDGAKGEFVRILTDRGGVLVFRTNEAQSATRDTLTRYSISHDRWPVSVPASGWGAER